MLIALRSIDEVIKIIKGSKDRGEAKSRLMANFELSEEQTDAILQMRLQQLTGLEQDKLREEHGALLDRIRYYRDVLGDRSLLLDIIREDVYEVKEKYGDPRRTEFAPEVEEIELEDLIAEETVAVTISHEGYIKRQPISSYRAQQRGGKGITGASHKEGDFIEHFFVASTHDYILFFSGRGRAYWLKVYDTPELGRTSRGRAIVNLLETQKGERFTSMIPVGDFASGYLVMATERGVIKRTKLDAFSHPRRAGIIAIGLDQGDRLIGVRRTTGKEQVALATTLGKAIRFNEGAVRSMGRTARGVRGITLRKEDSVVALVTGSESDDLLTLCEHGFGKRTLLSQYRLTGRGAQGVINIRTTKRNGNVVGVLNVTHEDDVMMITSGGMVVRTSMKNIRSIGRATQGVKLISLKSSDSLVGVARVLGEAAQQKETAEAAEVEPEAAPKAKPPAKPKETKPKAGKKAETPKKATAKKKPKPAPRSAGKKRPRSKRAKE